MLECFMNWGYLKVNSVYAKWLYKNTFVSSIRLDKCLLPMRQIRMKLKFNIKIKIFKMMQIPLRISSSEMYFVVKNKYLTTKDH